MPNKRSNMTTIPVSKYEELLHTVRSLKQQTIRVHQLASPLLDTIVTANERLASSSTTSDFGNLPIPDDCWDSDEKYQRDFDCQDDLNDFHRYTSHDMDSLVIEHKNTGTQMFDETSHSSHSGIYEDDLNHHQNKNMSISSEPDSADRRNVSLLYHGTWPVERAMWNSEPPNLRDHQSGNQIEITSVMSFASSSGAAPLDRVLNEDVRGRTSQQLEVKVDMVYSLLSMLGTQECPDMGETLLALSSSPDSSLAMRQAGCLPVLVQLVYSDKDRETRGKASKALFNLIQVQPDDKLRKREVKVIRLLDEIRGYCDLVEDSLKNEEMKDKLNDHPTGVTETIIKLSFDEGYRQTICELGGIYALAHIVESDHLAHNDENEKCVVIRRYAGMALTNLTFGHSLNKALLCSFRDFMKCLVNQLKSESDELRQVTASVIRNLSWRADASSRLILREVGAVPALMSAALISHKESTLKSILSALWNLSAHCSMNKADICSVEGALGFLVDMLSFKPPSKTLVIIENAGGILRNISSHIAVREDYRAVLRQHNCLQVLLQQLKSPSLTIVSNACGTLWNLSAKSAEDQKTLWDLGAAPMLKSLNHSKHIMIATGSRAALKNLLSSRPTHSLFTHVDMTAKELGLPALPTLGVRKQRALAKELDQNLSETCDNIEPTSPLYESTKAQRKFKYYQDSEHSNIVDNFSSLTINDTRSYTNNFNSLNYTQSQRTTTKLYTKFDRSFDDDDHDSCDQPVDYSQKYSENKSFLKKKNDFPIYKQQNYTKKTEEKAEFRNNSEFTPVDYTNKTEFTPVDYTNKTEFSPVDFTKKSEFRPVEFESVYPNKPVDYSKKSDFEPIDYSKKYGETSTSSATGTLPKNCIKTEPKNQEYLYIPKADYYAETDLDQPTNYSLRYGENDSDSEDIHDTENIRTQPQFYEQDTVKTYCTEGTPYETPYNFSTATSLSDLRIDHNSEEKEKPVEDVKESIEDSNKTDGKIKTCYSSGMMSPEKTVNYCEEGTPGYFSRVSSLSSLNATGADGILDKKKETVQDENDTEVEVKNEIKNDKEGAKVVTFGRVVNYAEETPMMFSRSSSLGSLSSTEQHSIHDDRSSVSDFSRLTSGIISPSELPDSPTQTVPPSPRHRKSSEDFPPPPAQPVTQSTPKSVFEDNIIKFKEVNTPVEFSTNTSLSSLTIDDEPSLPTKLTLLQDGTIERNNTEESSGSSENVLEKIDEKKPMDDGNKTDLSTVSEEEEEDENILAACINIGMQNNRHRQNKQPISVSPKPRSHIPSALPKYQIKPSSSRTGIPIKLRSPKGIDHPTDTLQTYCTEDTPAMLSNAGSHSDLSILSITSKDKLHENDEKPDFSDDSSNLSGDNDNILAECIQSGMPKAKRPIIQPKIPTFKPRPTTGLTTQNLLKNVQYFGAKDEIENYAVEDSPCHFSLRSSLSDLTVDGQVIGKTDKNTKKYNSYTSPNYLTNDHNKENKREIETGCNSKDPANEERVLSRQGSLSSLSVESYGSTENAEQALLEQCISIGMPKSNKNPYDLPLKHTPNKIADKPDNSKNVYVTSVVVNTQQKLETATDVEKTKTVETERIHGSNTENETVKKNGFDNETNLNYEENIKDFNIKNDYDNKCSDVLTDYSLEDNASPDISDSENSKKLIKNRMLDPDAMIESLDRFTAELVSHSSHLNSHECKIMSNDCGTWSEDTSPNDVSFPSISISAPLVASFKSETDSKVSDKIEKEPEPEFSSFNTMSDSTIIAMEATKIYNVVHESMQQSRTSMHSLDLEHINPPSMMESMISLTSSVSLQQNIPSPKQSPIASRKKSLPPGLMVRRALGNTTQKSLESLNDVSISSNLEQQKPPSVMGDYLDMIDMESSMVSVASITSEIAENKTEGNDIAGNDIGGNYINWNEIGSNIGSNERKSNIARWNNIGSNETTRAQLNDIRSIGNGTSKITSNEMGSSKIISNEIDVSEIESSNSETPKNWTFDIKQPIMNMFTNSLVSDIENINPPSLLNEVTDLCNSTADIITENVYSESTDVFEDCFTHTMDQTLQQEYTMDEITEYSDANSLTPVQSDFASSSNESTPKKSRSINKKLTPKQKRQLTKERYKTYTVAAEMVIQEEMNRSMQSTEKPELKSKLKTEMRFDFKNSQSPDSSNVQSFETCTSDTPKLTPKERRQLDRERFQTRVLQPSPVDNIVSKFATFSRSSLQMSLSKLETKSEEDNLKNGVESTDESREDIREVRSRGGDKVEISDPKRSSIPSLASTNKPEASPPRSPRNKTSIRKAMQQKRLENKDRFRTRTISSDTPSPEISTSPDRRLLTSDEFKTLQHEANKILNTLEQSTSNVDELLDCETLSLVSNEDSSEHNSVSSSYNYRTYHKSWGFNKNLPVVDTDLKPQSNLQITTQLETNIVSTEVVEIPKIVKPKIVKPDLEAPPVGETEEVEEAKAVRGKKKAAYVSPYRSPNLDRTKPVKTVTSNLVKNVTQSIKNTTVKSKIATVSPRLKPPASNRSSVPKATSPNKTQIKRQSLPTPKIERQGTFVKEDSTPEASGSETSKKVSEIPPAAPKTSKIARAIAQTKSKSATQLKTPQKLQSKIITSTSTSRFYNRSPSADRNVLKNPIQNSSSSQSLQNQDTKKRSSIPSLTQRSNSNVSIGSSESTGKKKQVTSKIASLWKRVEESKKKTPEKKDSKVWITPNKNTDPCDSTTILTF